MKDAVMWISIIVGGAYILNYKLERSRLIQDLVTMKHALSEYQIEILKRYEKDIDIENSNFSVVRSFRRNGFNRNLDTFLHNVQYDIRRCESYARSKYCHQEEAEEFWQIADALTDIQDDIVKLRFQYRKE